MASAVKFDVVSFIMGYESGEIDTEHEVVEGFQALIDDGSVWSLQGCYGRMAVALIHGGYCEDTHGRLAVNRN